MLQVSFNDAILNEIRDKESDMPLLLKSSYGPQYKFDEESVLGEAVFSKTAPGETDGSLATTGSYFIEIPPLLDSNSSTSTSVETATSAVSRASTVSIIINFLLAAFLGGSLKMLWDALNSLGNILYIPWLAVNMPGIVQLVLNELIPMTQFEMIPVDQIYQFFGFEESEAPPRNNKYQSIGFDDINFINGLGGGFIYMFLFVAAHICLFIYRLIYGKTDKHKKWM